MSLRSGAIVFSVPGATERFGVALVSASVPISGERRLRRKWREVRHAQEVVGARREVRIQLGTSDADEATLY